MFDNITIKTNNHPRPFLYRNEVPDKILENDFDWLDNDVIDGFIKYRGNYYHVKSLRDLTMVGPQITNMNMMDT